MAVSPLPPKREETIPVVFVFSPKVVPVTFTVTVQVLPPFTNTFETFIEPEPAVAVMLPNPKAQVVVSPFGVATAKPVGRVSLTETIAGRIVGSTFPRVMVRLVVPFRGNALTANALLMVGGWVLMVMVASLSTMVVNPTVTTVTVV